MPGDKFDRVDRIFAYLLVCVLQTRGNLQHQPYSMDSLMLDMFNIFGLPVEDYLRKKYQKAMRFMKDVFERHGCKQMTVWLKNNYQEFLNPENFGWVKFEDAAGASSLMIETNMPHDVTTSFLNNIIQMSDDEINLENMSYAEFKATCTKYLEKIFHVAFVRQGRFENEQAPLIPPLVLTREGLSHAAGLNYAGVADVILAEIVANVVGEDAHEDDH